MNAPRLASKVGLIGYGYAGQTFHAPLIRATDGLQLVAVASSDPQKVHAALGLDIAVMAAADLIRCDDLDLVVIATPNDLHHPLALAALRAGRDVVIDKPFALDAAQAEELIAEAERGGRLLSVFHNRRWDGDFLTLQQVLADGRVGRPVELVSHFDRYRPQVRERWREAAGPGAGLWLDLGPHLVDQALVLFGPPSAITLDQARVRDGALADDWFHAQLRWAQGPLAGLRVQLHASALAAHPGARFTLHGTRGSFTVDGLDPQEDALKAGANPARIAAADWGRDERRATFWPGDAATHRAEVVPLGNGRYPSYYAGILRAMRAEAEAPVTARQALAVQRVLDAGRASARLRCEQALTLD